MWQLFAFRSLPTPIDMNGVAFIESSHSFDVGISVRELPSIGRWRCVCVCAPWTHRMRFGILEDLMTCVGTGGAIHVLCAMIRRRCRRLVF